jgi:gas vesicle protein
MATKESGTIYFIAGLLFGGIVGAGIGLTMSPETAAQAREKIKTTGSKVWKESKDAYEKFEVSQLNPLMDKISEKVKETVAEVQTEGVESTVNKVINKVQSAVNKKATKVLPVIKKTGSKAKIIKINK